MESCFQGATLPVRFGTQGVNISHYFGCLEEQRRGEVPGSIRRNQWQKKTETPFSGCWLQVTKQSKCRSAWYVNEPQKGNLLPAWSLDLSPVLAYTQSWKDAFPFRNDLIFMVTTGETTVLWVFQAPPFPAPLVWSRNPHRRHSTEVFFLFALPTLFSYIWKNTFRGVYQHPKFLSVCSFGSAHHTEGFCAAGNHDDGLLVILCCHGPDFIWYLQCNPSKEILKWQNASIQIPVLLYTEVTAWNSWLSFLLSLRRVMWFLAHGNVGGFTTHTSEASSFFIWLILFHNFLHIFSSPNSS